MFSAAGVRDGSVRDVAERAGMTHAGLRHHFPTKLDLLQAVLTWRDQDALQRLDALHVDGVDVIRAWLAEVGRSRDTPELVDLHVTLSAEGTSVDHPLHEYFVRRYDRLVVGLRQALELAESRGELLPDVDCEHAARILIAVTDGLQVQWLLDRESVDMVAMLRRHLGSIVAVPL
ncbi:MULTISPECIES: TetR/AcrR family transcriptional regulator [Arsenicicoccus]|uniref:TetR/AcrR family transcriptional regulator n=1 Tax=Arsenicicoccus TaxID=267408 RepID=UPI0004237A35|nr:MULTISPECIES: TetR/AcrR family transcriptional regulator [Arsenicicoccus]